VDKLKSKVVVITGSSSGVGRAIAHEFARSEASVVLLARDKDALEATKKEVEELGGVGHYFSVDVSRPEEIEKAAEEVERDIGPIDYWVNNAMNSVFSPFKEMTAREFRRVTEVTYLGQVYGTMTALKYMLPRDRGKIILVGSALAYRGIPLQSAYCGAKHGIQGFFDSLRVELIHDNSRVGLTIVELPALNTTQFEWVKSRLPKKPRPMGTIFQPEVAARAVKYAALNDRREIFVGMPTFQTIIGNKFFPGLLDKILAKSGIKGQQTDEPVDPDRQHNLWEPVRGVHRTHGRFDDLAKDKSPMLWVSMHWQQVWGMILAAVFLIIAMFIVL
jgi:short-subunit dehydrogenase